MSLHLDGKKQYEYHRYPEKKTDFMIRIPYFFTKKKYSPLYSFTSFYLGQSGKAFYSENLSALCFFCFIMLPISYWHDLTVFFFPVKVFLCNCFRNKKVNLYLRCKLKWFIMHSVELFCSNCQGIVLFLACFSCP